MNSPASATRTLIPLTMGFAALLLLSNIIAQKLIHISIFILPASILIYPLLYSLGSMITELYGKQIGVIVTITATFLNVFMVLIFWLVLLLPSASVYHGQAELSQVLGAAPRIVFASIVSFFIGELVNVLLTAALKHHVRISLPLRTCLCNLLGLSIDCVIFCMIAFRDLGIREIFVVAGSYYLFKVIYQLLLVIVVRHHFLYLRFHRKHL